MSRMESHRIPALLRNPWVRHHPGTWKCGLKWTKSDEPRCCPCIFKNFECGPTGYRANSNECTSLTQWTSHWNNDIAKDRPNFNTFPWALLRVCFLSITSTFITLSSYLPYRVVEAYWSELQCCYNAADKLWISDVNAYVIKRTTFSTLLSESCWNSADLLKYLCLEMLSI